MKRDSFELRGASRLWEAGLDMEAAGRSRLAAVEALSAGPPSSWRSAAQRWGR